MKSIKNRAKRLLLSAGVNPSYMGFEVLAEAIVLCYNDQDLIYNITTKLYKILSVKVGRSCTAVERNIRRAVTMACEDEEIVSSVLGFSIGAVKCGKVNNKSFIAACVQVLKMEDDES